jgi:signal transduction histidine kinase
VRGYGILVTRLIAIAALVITVLGGQYLQVHPEPLTTLAIGLLLLITVSAMLIPSGATESVVTLPRWAEVTGIVTFTLAGGALCVLVPDGTAVALPFIAAWFTPRVAMSRAVEIGLLVVDVAALLAFSLIVSSPWWMYPVVLAGVLATYQAGLRSRERLERAEIAELMLAREQALRSERERAAAAAERARIARDLHDVLAHTLSGLAITLQNASTLLHAGRTEGARTQVDRARALAVEGQAEARQALAALAPEPGDGPPSVDLPSAIDRAVRDHRALTGSPVTLSIGPLPDVPAVVTDAALAVLRESLTNVIRHAPDAPVSVSARVSDESPGRALRLRVTDDPGGAAPAAGEGGNGVTGMRARVGAVGGTLRAGPTPTGWAVELTVPLVQHTPDEGPGTMSR